LVVHNIVIELGASLFVKRLIFFFSFLTWLRD
jgi:hypothetical protein